MLQIITIALIILHHPLKSITFPMHPQSSIDKYRNRLHINNSNRMITSPSRNSRVPQSPVLQSHPYFNQGGKRSFMHTFKDRKSDTFVKSGMKRGVNIGVHVNISATTPKFVESLEKLDDLLEKALSGRLETLGTSECPMCDEEEVPGLPIKRIVKPAYGCDEWDSKRRICILERNIGDTVTFFLSTGSEKGHKLNVTWMKEFHVRDSNIRKEFVIDPENSPENIIIGRGGYEFRLSPITETDFGFNVFSASLNGYSSYNSKVYFMLRIVPIDLGFVYVGETIELNLRSYGSLPARSMTYKWYMERDEEHGTLPSNMKMSLDGSSMKISELRQEQEGILACSVYTNLNILATKKRFLMKDLVKNNDVLKSPPDHSLIFKEAFDRGKRVPKTKPRSKREIDMDEIVEKALMESTPTEKPLKYTTTQENDYNLEMDIAPAAKNYGDSLQRPENYETGFQEISNKDDESGNIPPANEIDISVGNGPEEVQHAHRPVLDNSQQMYIKEGFPNPTAGSVEIDYQPALDKTEMENNQQNYADDRAEYQGPQVNLEVQSGDMLTPSTHRKVSSQQYKMTPQKPVEGIKKQYPGTNMQNKKATYTPPTDNSGIILSIDKFPRPRKIPAEERIAKLISSCLNDFECSGSAICMRPNLKEVGFCKCLPGFYGVGIFCRKDIWIINSNLDM